MSTHKSWVTLRLWKRSRNSFTMSCHRQKLLLSYYTLFMSFGSYYALSNLPSLMVGQQGCCITTSASLLLSWDSRTCNPSPAPVAPRSSARSCPIFCPLGLQSPWVYSHPPHVFSPSETLIITALLDSNTTNSSLPSLRLIPNFRTF